MRFFLLLLFFPFIGFSQELPDSSVASRMKVKKLIILKCNNGLPVDTENVLVFDGKWKYENGLPFFKSSEISSLYDADTSRQKVVRDEKGRIVFITAKNPKGHCYFDSVGYSYCYDNKNRIIETAYHSCEKGVNRCHYYYDKDGKLILKICDRWGDILVNREEFTYSKSGNLDSIVSWYASNPQNSKRDSTDDFVASIKYSYDKNGLITEAIANDPMRHCYATSDWGKPEFFENKLPATVVFRYIYVY
jgi:hypothetical protein